MTRDPLAFLILVALIVIVIIKNLRLNTIRQVQQNIRKLPNSFKYRVDFKLRAPKDRLYKVNYILITFAGVFLIHVVEELGVIEGDEKDQNWNTQGRFKTKEFANPIMFAKKLVPLVKEITDKVKGDIPIYPVVVFNNRAKIENISSESIPVIKAKDLISYINSRNKDKLDQPDINVILDELKKYRFDYE